jgi:hypothetical protein
VPSLVPRDAVLNLPPLGYSQASQRLAEMSGRDRLRREEPLAGTGDQGQGLPPLAISAGGKGAAMLPEARRRRARAPEQKVRTFEKRAGTGQKKGGKQMAGTGWVPGVAVPGGPGPHPGAGHAPGGRYRQDEAAGGEPPVHLRYHRGPGRHRRPSPRRGRPP